MTMPVLALLTPATAPQTQIGTQAALMDYSEGQQQSYSEDLAALLAGMEAALAALDTEVQQLPEGTDSQTKSEDVVQSMLPQPLLFDPLLPAETVEPDVVVLPLSEILPDLPEDLTAVQPGVSSYASQQEANAAQQAQSVATSQWLSLVASPALATVGPEASSASILPLAAVTRQAGEASDLARIQTELQQRAAPAADQTTALLSALKQSQLSAQNTALGSSFTLNQNNIQASSLTKAAGLHQVMAELLSPVAAVNPAHSAANSALPVWQADPLPAQSQHWGQRLVQMLADKVDLQLGLNVKSAMIRLDPPSLGSIELSVQMDGDRLTVQMHSSNTQLREAMGQGLEQLRASLQQKLGADVQIELRMGSDSSSEQQRQQQQQNAQQAELNFHSEPEMTLTEATQPNKLNLVNQLV